MYNIIKAQMYQAFRENGTYYTFLGGLVMFGISMLSVFSDEPDWLATTGSKALSFGTATAVLIFVSLIFTARICGGDMDDKTINYEMLTGTSRGKVYGGRIIISIIFTLLIYLIFAVLPIVVFTVKNGWGYTIPKNEAILRLCLQFLPLLKLVCFYAFLTFVTMNVGAVLLSGVVLFLIEAIVDMVVTEVLEKSARVLYPFFSYDAIDATNHYNMTYGFIEGKDVPVLGSGISNTDIALIAIPAVVTGAAFLIVGYFIFRRKDMN
ncbi:MAG: ABC transporter permease subunit [Ruminococcus sp.]|nr:ABC transporter permease subunit [Ruminococcus sp.]